MGFTKPVGTSNMELPAGQVTELLIGFTNKGEQEMMVDSLEASLRYPMDFTFHIQNFTTATFSKAVKPGQQATVGYSFVPADAFAGRPIGLTINLNYRDAAGNFFIDPVFNETVQIVEFDEGDDGVDYEWIPKSALRNTPASGKTSPRQRKNKAGSDSD